MERLRHGKARSLDVHDELSHQVWRTNAGVLSYEECTTSSDVDLRAFAKSVGPTYEFVDLRSPKLGDGFSWGRYGRRFVVKRCGEKTHLRKPNKQVAMAEIQGCTEMTAINRLRR